MDNDKALLDKLMEKCEIDPDMLYYSEWMAESLVDSGVRVMPLLLNEKVYIPKRRGTYYIKSVRYEWDEFDDGWIYTAVCEEDTRKTYTFTDTDIGKTVFA